MLRDKLGATVIALLSLAALMTPAAATEKITISQQQSTVASVAAVGVLNGYFKDQGIELESRWALRGVDTIQAVAAGQADFGIAAVTPLVGAQMQGLPLVMIGVHSYAFPGFLVAHSKHPEAKDLAYFKGKRIGVQVGTGVHTVLQMAIEKAGLKDDDVTVANVRVNDMPSAMQAAAFDAVVGWVPFSSRIVSMGTGRVVMEPVQFERMLGITYPLILFTTAGHIEKRRDAVQRFMNAWAKSQAFVNKNKKETVAALRQTLTDRIKGFDDPTLESMIYVYKHDRTVLSDGDRNDIQNMSAFLVSRKQLKGMPDMAKIMDNSFAIKADAQVSYK
jgi:ABC-type nitrate/sulfonate/bicarbonate transport system substrate-binding protein